MQRFEADYFDGRSSRRHPAEVVVLSGRAIVTSHTGIRLEYAADELRVQPRIGRTPQRIVLPDGGLLITQASLEGILAVPRATGFAHRLESNVRVVLASLVGLAVAVFIGYRYGIPWAAEKVATNLPPEIEKEIAVEGMKSLDGYVFKPSTLDPGRQGKLAGIFARLHEGGTVPARLVFRDGTFIGANAFALPGGVVVMTDQLAETIEDDDQVAAVLAHELGHLEHRHGMRHILQDSITALFASAVLGDLSSIASLAATLPTLVMHTSNSRDFERDADRFAYGLLKKTGRSPRLLGQALTALQAAHDRRGAQGGCKVPLDGPEGRDDEEAQNPSERGKSDFSLGYLSTHPATPERVQAAEEAAK